MKRTPTAAESTPEFFSSQVRHAQRFYFDLAPDASRPLAVVCGGREACSPDYRIERTTFPYFSVEFVARGKGTLRLADGETPLLPGSVFAYGPGIPHQIQTDPQDPLVKYFLDFVGSRAEPLLAELGWSRGACGRAFAHAEIESIFDALIQNGLRGTRFSESICNAMIEYLLLKIAESLNTFEAAQSPAFATFQRCREFIQAHFVRLQSVAQIARQCHVDAAYLCRLFQRYDHQTPHQFLIRLKMNLAAQRLQTTNALVKQVAAELGFDDPFHFSRAFKSALGVSPDAFRRLR